MTPVGMTLALMVLIVATSAHAGFVDVPADVSVSLHAEPDTGIVLGDAVVVTIAATNHGPNAIDNLLLISSDFVDEIATASNDCEGFVLVVSDGETYHYNYWWRPTASGVLGVGETRSCHLSLALSPQAPAVWTFEFAVPFFYIDIDPTNNAGSVTLRRAREPAIAVPVSSRLALTALTVLVALLGGVALAKRSGTCAPCGRIRA